ncbi:hypothetical protein BC828DRAFT_387152 [Blastocladiella britannica]|nr:hypothetical protein BC828DRAFT_387152 [Blastocladiella britannica]
MVSVWASPVPESLLSVALVTATTLCVLNALEWRRRKLPLLSLHGALLLGSLILIAHQCVFLAITAVPAATIPFGCTVWIVLEPLLYSLIQLIFTTALIVRSTATLSLHAPPTRGPSSAKNSQWSTQQMARAVLLILFALAFGTGLVSSVLATANVTPQGYCVYVPNLAWNLPSKLLYMCIYTVLATIFMAALVSHLVGFQAGTGAGTPAETGGSTGNSGVPAASGANAVVVIVDGSGAPSDVGSSSSPRPLPSLGIGGPISSPSSGLIAPFLIPASPSCTSPAMAGGPTPTPSTSTGNVSMLMGVPLKDARRVVSSILLSGAASAYGDDDDDHHDPHLPTPPPATTAPNPASGTGFTTKRISNGVSVMMNRRQAMRAQRPIVRLVRTVTFRLALALAVVLVTSVTAEYGVFDGGGLLVSFSIQNQAIVFCATLVTARRSKRRKRKGRRTVRTAPPAAAAGAPATPAPTVTAGRRSVVPIWDRIRGVPAADLFRPTANAAKAAVLLRGLSSRNHPHGNSGGSRLEPVIGASLTDGDGEEEGTDRSDGDDLSRYSSSGAAGATTSAAGPEPKRRTSVWFPSAAAGQQYPARSEAVVAEALLAVQEEAGGPILPPSNDTFPTSESITPTSN